MQTLSETTETLTLDSTVPSSNEPGAPDDALGALPETGSTSLSAFLAMREQRRIAHARRLRFKLAGLATVGLGALAAFGFLRDRPVARAQAETAVPAAPQAAAPAHAAAPVEPPAPPPAVEAPPAATPAAPMPDAEAEAGCATTFSAKNWSDAIASCTVAFAAAPSAASAMKLAHAHWSRGLVSDAHAWATKAVELGTSDPDAYVLIGHGERRVGNAGAAKSAYRKYLDLAPRGWHATRVRAALQALGTARG